MKICGRKVILEYLNGNHPILEIYLQRDFCDQTILEKIQKKKIPVITCPKQKLDQLTKEHHQGIVAEIAEFHYHSLESIQKENGFLVILDHLEDPHNLGAIIRTCEAAGCDGIIIPKDRSVKVNSTVIRISMGAIDRVPIVQVSNIHQTIQWLKKQNYWIIGTDMTGEEYQTLPYDGSIAIVIGNEGKGLSTLTRTNCDFIAKIPMVGKINSLNASVATGIILFKALEKRQ